MLRSGRGAQHGLPLAQDDVDACARGGLSVGREGLGHEPRRADPQRQRSGQGQDPGVPHDPVAFDDLDDGRRSRLCGGDVDPEWPELTSVVHECARDGAGQGENDDDRRHRPERPPLASSRPREPVLDFVHRG